MSRAKQSYAWFAAKFPRCKKARGVTAIDFLCDLLFDEVLVNHSIPRQHRKASHIRGHKTDEGSSDEE